jgi:hypothetical protein
VESSDFPSEKRTNQKAKKLNLWLGNEYFADEIGTLN